MKEKIKVLVVDDSAVVRQTMSEILNSTPDIEVVAVARDPLVAADKLKTIKPDVITLDIEMPRMDGLTFLQQIMNTNPIPVIMCSSQAEEHSQNALAALENGAVDIIRKPKLGTKQFIEESKIIISDAVRSAAAAGPVKHPAKAAQAKAAPSKLRVAPKLSADVILSGNAGHVFETTEKVVAVGASTGGTEALRAFLEALPGNSPGIVIVQHMPEKFTASFAERLNSLCEVKVKEAANNDSVLRGHVLIAPGNKHMLLKRSGARYYVEVKDGPLVSRHRPSVDVLFRSTARYAGKNAIGIIMTGMGDDGAVGMLEMKQAGAYNIAQDEASCVVFGMPNEAIKKGGVDSVIPLKEIPAVMLKESVSY
ncbi:MAG: chemotaxis response regulator protein-glutamate methylesterase [Spirochaetales bacterium]|uniref:Protein-glutamate methylesterase/protein-glutamine glutaminase n=1 Tax=Candidatus Thalassospirochaeta sargassi TaxID=3119039 RepID=A0AAJ1IHC0_9SPIO|nr:chemotaxis response regulator protein-glutamate methylesterase [Spirochaetales bacterium]